jgi:hypothetical protein
MMRRGAVPSRAASEAKLMGCDAKQCEAIFRRIREKASESAN